jgi:hypothetical protein
MMAGLLLIEEHSYWKKGLRSLRFQKVWKSLVALVSLHTCCIATSIAEVMTTEATFCWGWWEVEVVADSVM